MPNFAVRVSLLISSLAPIILVWSIVDFIECGLSFGLMTWILLGTVLLFLFLPPLILYMCKSKLGNETVTYKSAKILENGGEGFIGTYILPFLSNVITDQWYILMIGVMLVLTIVIWVPVL